MPEVNEWIRRIAQPGETVAQLFCNVLAIGGGAILTRCRGRLPEADEIEVAPRPLVADRCTCCQSQYAAAQLDALARGCGDRTMRHSIEAGLAELRRFE